MKKFFKTIGRDLRKQVQKAGVAAGKQSTTNLDVLGKGFKIGQAQSTGATSIKEEKAICVAFGKSQRKK